MTPGLGEAGLAGALAASVGAGLLSFLSPCVLPLVPAYLSYLSGYGSADLSSKDGRVRARLFARALAFTLGFTLVFVGLGLVFAGGGFLTGGAEWLRLASGVAVIILGLNLIFDVLKILNLERRFRAPRPAASGLKGLAGAALLGVAFAAGWSPCIGPILASILLLAAREGSVARGGILLGAYSLGLALPFLAAGLAFDRTKPLLDWAKRRGRGIRIGAGLLLCLLGLLMATGRLGLVSGIASRAGFGLAAAREAQPGLVLGVDLGVMVVAALGILAAWLRSGRPRGRPLGALGWAGLVLLAVGAIAEALGIWSLSGLLASWLAFQGG